MALTTKDKKHLKSRGQTMQDDARLGKHGLTDGFVVNLQTLLTRKELVKIRFTDVEGDERKDLAAQLSAAADAELVAVTGRTALLYRPNPTLDPIKRALPTP